MARFVLVHGAWHGGWCWQKVAPLLQAEGHTVDAVDLPGHGDSPATIGDMTLETYARRVVDHVEAAGGPVVLVGHSMGGMSITQAAELAVDRIETLVYVTAFLPNDGQSLVQLAEGDPDALVHPNLIVDEAAGSCTVAEQARRDTFYGECSAEDAAQAAARLVPESLAAMGTPIRVTEERAGSIRRIYVECLRDRAISIAKQREMWAARPCEQVLAIDTDHSPFLSRPQELVRQLLSVAG
jgi:pimeloyl-ACP methyl ester carboxylesterase